MKIRELTGYHNTPIQDIKQKARDEFSGGKKTGYNSTAFKNFYEYIQQHGFNKVGAGNNAEVYEKAGHPWLFKVFNGDPAYLSYYKYCRTSQSNPHVPRVKGRPIKLADNTYCVQIEKLRPFPTNSMKFIAILQNAAMGYVDEYQYDYDVIKDYKRSINLIRSKFPDLIRLIRDLSAFKQYTFDLDESNIMMRGPIPVLTDPFS